MVPQSSASMVVIWAEESLRCPRPSRPRMISWSTWNYKKKIIFDNVKVGDLLAQQVVDAIPSLPNKTHLESIVVRADNHPKGCKNKKRPGDSESGDRTQSSWISPLCAASWSWRGARCLLAGLRHWRALRRKFLFNFLHQRN